MLGAILHAKNLRRCSPLTYASELKTHLIEMYISAAQYNAPPTYPVNKVCGGIDGGGFGDDVLGKIFGVLLLIKEIGHAMSTHPLTNLHYLGGGGGR